MVLLGALACDRDSMALALKRLLLLGVMPPPAMG